MKIVLRQLIVLFFLFGLIISSCKKEENDSADKFVGMYGYTLTAETFFESDEITITKISSDKISIMRADSVSRLYSIVDNKIIEDAGFEAEHIKMQGGGWATFIENSTGTINGNKLTINGTWTSPYWDPITFQIVATKK